jgi:anti-sigma regulatory factor (Ser/Thr protein kinase)
MDHGIILKKRKTDVIKRGSHYMDLGFGREWGNITLVKAFFENFIIAKMQSSEDIHKVGIAVSELLENAVKYSNKDGVRIIIQKMKKNGTVKIRVYNYAASNILTILKSG